VLLHLDVSIFCNDFITALPIFIEHQHTDARY